MRPGRATGGGATGLPPRFRAGPGGGGRRATLLVVERSDELELIATCGRRLVLGGMSS